MVLPTDILSGHRQALFSPFSESQTPTLGLRITHTVGGRYFEISMLSRLCKDNQGEYVCIIPACSSPDLTTDSILDLEAKKGGGRHWA